MKYCSHCGAEHCDDAVICTKCGCALDPISKEIKPTEKTKEEKYALAGMVLGIIGLACSGSLVAGLVCSILGIIFSSLARKKTKSGQATAGLITGIIGLSITAIIIFIEILYFGYVFWLFAFLC